MATITTRIPDNTKAEAQKLADEFGIPLSTLIHMWIKDFLRSKKISISTGDDTTLDRYATKDMVPVNEPIKNVIWFLEDDLNE